MADLILLDIPTAHGSWQRVCKKRLSPQCKITFISKVAWPACGPCDQAQKRLDKIAKEAWIDKNGLTPDCDERTGFLRILREDERWKMGYIGKWV